MRRECHQPKRLGIPKALSRLRRLRNAGTNSHLSRLEQAAKTAIAAELGRREMTDDERAIRKLVETWMEASKRGDTATVLTLMTDDAVFMVPGREPFGKEVFAAAAAADGMAGVHTQGTNDIVELQLLGNWAFIRGRIDMTATPPNGEPVHRSGYTLTLLHKEADGHWRLARDANLLTTQS
jgi:uncharacterized protein (TIGR02246 family)